MSKNVEHSLEKTPCRGAHREIYKFHTSVISTHFFDQVEIFFFLTHCIVNNSNNNNNNNNNDNNNNKGKELEKIEECQFLREEIEKLMLWKLNQVTAELIVPDWGIGSRYV